MPSLRIHPSIGVARIGNSDQFYIGPENPGIPGNWDPDAQKFKAFKDAQGKILRQAARFRIFQFDDSGRIHPKQLGTTWEQLVPNAG